MKPVFAKASIRRVAVLYSQLSGYLASCLKAVTERHKVELLIIRTPPVPNAPFDDRHFSWITHLHDRTAHDVRSMAALLHDFNPDGVYMSGWSDRAYLWLARQQRQQGKPVVAGSDNQWKGTLRQQVGRFIAPYYLHPAIDALWVAGDRQRQFAARLGYRGARCWDGIYSCDWPTFDEVYAPESTPGNPFFLFVGRYVQVKGLDTLLEAYDTYRARVEEPWPLRCAGTGPLADLLRGQPGIENLGFTQPDALPELMASAGAFILPSQHEPWGVVVHEAAATGLPLICTEACGAAVHLLRDGYNGFLVATGSVEELAAAMVRMTDQSAQQRKEMGRRSHGLSRQYTPARWADTLIQGLARLRG